MQLNGAAEISLARLQATIGNKLYRSVHFAMIHSTVMSGPLRRLNFNTDASGQRNGCGFSLAGGMSVVKRAFARSRRWLAEGSAFGPQTV